MESTVLKRVSNASCLNLRPSRGQHLVTAAAQQGAKGPANSGAQLADIYIGFQKEDGFGSREGRKGRVIKDDPRKYPSRDEWGTGGWAGGEAGLWKLREQVKAQKEKEAPKAAAKPPSRAASVPSKPPPGKEVIYVGFNKDEIDLRKSGAKGRVLVDDPRKYPGKEDIGLLAGVAGGFAGGEAGVKQFVATGDVKFRKPGEPGRRQFSPLTLAGLVALAGAVGGIVLDLVTDAGENAVSRELLQAPIDQNTKLLILSAMGLVGVSGVIIGTTAALRALKERIQDTAKNAAVSGVFLLVVYLIAKSILEEI
ncbi:hypothetical protein Agub_g2084 [Astrephomene gubernaculifera]|uniref:Uncharacterized protein n=1 Tax=Astrephomene gubernaculifera TaxID=47775 RepID=A0AAD3HHD9_9CHLO|nr:hypothetical protein Agub_g2084 [Astrephomene gubernaculifera]